MDKITEILKVNEAYSKEEAHNILMEMLIETIAKSEDDRINRELLYDVILKNLELTKELKNKLIEIERLAVTDHLTQLFNRNKFNVELERHIDQFLRYHHPFSMILFDIDHFKHVNDDFGHNKGDEVLKGIAHICSENVRNVDILARWGGEEFIILLPNTTQDGAALLAEKLRGIIEVQDFDMGRNLTCSFGVSQFEENDTKDSFVGKADSALYFSKNQGRNRVTVWKA